MGKLQDRWGPELGLVGQGVKRDKTKREKPMKRFS